MPRWCLMAHKGINGVWVWHVIDRSQLGEDGYALIVASGEATSVLKARAAADAAHAAATSDSRASVLA
jgi:hypothetical protein